LRVVEEGRGVARFIAKQVEVEAKKRGQVGVIGDVRSNQLGLVRFMTGLGYTPIQTIPLYEPSEPDVVCSIPLIFPIDILFRFFIFLVFL
jgi:hypothetical protein